MTSSISESCSTQLSYMPIFLNIPMGIDPMKKNFADSSNNHSGKGWYGYGGNWTLPSGATNLHAQKPIHHIPHNISERQDLNLQPLVSKTSILPFEILPDFSENRGHAPQALSGSHYLAGRFWTFQIYLPFFLIKKLPRCLFL